MRCIGCLKPRGDQRTRDMTPASSTTVLGRHEIKPQVTECGPVQASARRHRCATRVRTTVRDWVVFWDGHVELDALDLDALDAFAWDWATRSTSSPAPTPVWPGAGSQATRWWQAIWYDGNALVSLPRIHPTVAEHPGVPR